MHESVLLHESIEGLQMKPGDIFLDATLGLGGHSVEAIKQGKKKITVVGIDQDQDAIEKAGKDIAKYKIKFIPFLGNFRKLDEALSQNKISGVDKIIFDFGLNSTQFEESGRGFSFNRDEPLLMTLNRDPGERDLTARDVVNGFKQENLEQIIRGFGEERFAGRIARAIVERRAIKPIERTSELVETILSAIPTKFRKGKIHPATKTFQAIRITTNSELDSIREGLEKAFKFLNKRGRVATISFHSLEDRIVKHYFKELEKNKLVKIITKKPIVPSLDEIKRNPRARSAKLRIIEKI